MADLISVISLVEGSIGLVLQCGSVAKTLSDLKGKLKHAEVAIMSLIEEVETIQFAWSRIKEWSEDHAEAATDSQFVQRLEKSLECGTLVLSSLEQDLADYKNRADNANFVLRSKMAWNERAFLDHQNRVRGQVQAMTLLLQVSQLSTSKDQTKLLKKKDKAFRASDESAYSIIPSRMSSHMSVSTGSRDSFLTIESQELVYYPLSFENDLFTARVYKRNYRNSWISSLFKFHWVKKTEEKRVPTANPEVSDDGQSSLLSSTGTTTPTIMSADVSQPGPSNQGISLSELESVSPCPVLTAETKIDPTDLERSVTVAGSVPSTFEESPRVSSGLQNRANRSLLQAVIEGNLDNVKTLIDRGARVNPHGDDQRPPLHLAVCNSDVSMTKLLLQEGANCEQEWRGTPPIHQACKDRRFEITQLLLDAGASAISLDAKQEQPLHAILSIGSPMPDVSGLIDLLISRGADINARTRTDKTPLHLSCDQDNVDNVRALLVHGADPTSIYDGGRTAFHTLAETVASSYTYQNSSAIFRLLHDHGTDVNVEDKVGDTPFHVFVKRIFSRRYALKAEHLDFFELFLVHGVNVNAQNRLGNTPFHILVSKWHGTNYGAEFKAIIKLLHHHGVDFDAQNGAGDTPLHILVTKALRYKAAIQPLLKHRVNVNAQNKVGNTPLHILLAADPHRDPSRQVDQRIFQSLIQHGALVNIQDVAGDTPLHIVARRVHSVDDNAEWKCLLNRRIIHRLLDVGADLSVENLKEESPQQLLEQAENRSVLRQI